MLKYAVLANGNMDDVKKKLDDIIDRTQKLVEHDDIDGATRDRLRTVQAKLIGVSEELRVYRRRRLFRVYGIPLVGAAAGYLIWYVIHGIPTAP